jgi:putative transcriptional regulator
MSKMFKKLKKGLEEAIAYEQGKIELRSEDVILPEPPKRYKAREIKKIRENYNYSQGVFARVLNVSVKTVQSWESGQRIPSHSALRLLEIIDKGIYNPELYKRK